jgi:hypothetical protein
MWSPLVVKESIPVMLLHLAFGQFTDDVQTYIATNKDNNFISKFAHVMSALYENEDQRLEAVSDVLNGYHIHLHLNCKVQGTAYAIDRDMSINIHNHYHSFVIVKVKNKTVTSNSEPYMQALMYYLQSTRTYAPTLSEYALLCFLVAIFG